MSKRNNQPRKGPRAVGPTARGGRSCKANYCWPGVGLATAVFGLVVSAQAGEPGAAPAASTEPTSIEVQLSPLVQRLLDDALTTEAERRRLRLFHGQWEQLTDPTPQEQAELALMRFKLLDPVLLDAGTPALVRAEAALQRGDAAASLAHLTGDDSARGALVRARAHEHVGNLDQAIGVLTPWRQRLELDQIDNAAQLTAAVEALITLARVEGRPAQDYQLAMSVLAKVRDELDPVYWPARIVEGRLLVEKDNRREAAKALLEALALNPKASAAWYHLGLLAVEAFDFTRGARTVEKLRAINPEHLLADLLEARSRLQQRDPAAARTVIEPALARYPDHLELLALLATTEALSYNDQQLEAALKRFDKLAPGNPLAAYTVGAFLATARQYEAGEAMLREATARQPNWPQPWVELGLLLMQAGNETAARTALNQAARLDPFNRRAANQLKLAEELLGYERIQTEHFVIKYRAGVDEALARDMPDELERIWRDVTSAFDHVPDRKTHIDIMSDAERFAVRITGMPEIWTIAACTGDVIALTPPRHGPNQHGTFNWANVIRHEFVHTVTLGQTHNRIPHWLTEACAVSQEITGRSYETCRLLASALHQDRLFELDQINWAFVRPKTPQGRPLAYAQADWMLEYLAATFGHRAVIDLIELYREGRTEADAMHQITGQDPPELMSGFKSWAAGQVTKWGLEPVNDDLAPGLIDSTEPIDAEQLDALLAEHPDHPELLRLHAERAVASGDPGAARPAVLRYAMARPVDPWPHHVLISLAAQAGEPQRAVASLEQLDREDNDSGRWAHQLARIHRAAGRFDTALDAMRRALFREPYNADFRELAAAVALQHEQPAYDEALHQIRLMAILEPDRATHQTRLAALYHRMGRAEDSRAAAELARELNPDAPVEKFLAGP